MTLVYDPRQPSKGRRITKRSRRRRNYSPSSASGKARTTKAPSKSYQEQLLGEDLLDFCNQLEESVPKVLKSKSIANRHKLQKISPKRSSAPATKVSQSGNRRRQTALAVDTRFIEVLRDTDLSRDIIQNAQYLLQMAVNRGVAPSLLSVSQLQQTQKGVSSIRVHSSSSPSNADLEPLYIPTQETTDEHGVVFQLPKLLAAKESWKLFGDYGKLVV